MLTEHRSIQSLLADICVGELGIGEPVDEFSPFTMEVLAPHRTLVEKLAALHSAGAHIENDSAALRPLGRHLYDVHGLLSSEAVRGRLDSGGDSTTLAADCHRISQLYGWSSTQRPTAGYASSDVFRLGSEANDALKAAYGLVGPLVYGSVPTFAECIASVHEHAALLLTAHTAQFYIPG